MAQLIDHLKHLLPDDQLHQHEGFALRLEAVVKVDVELINFDNVLVLDFDETLEFNYHLG